jgi:benzoate-CoA ligase family protein
VSPPFAPPARFNLAAYALWDRLGAGDGDRSAIVDDRGRYSYEEVRALAARFGHRLRRIGVRPEERVLLALPDRVEFPAALFGALAIGAVPVMINPDLRAEHLAEVAAYSRATALVSTRSFESVVATVESAPDPASVLLIEDFLPETESPELELYATHRDDPAMWLFSGGTTGAPKAVVQTHRSFANTTELYAKATLGYRPDDVTLSVPKLFFGYATGSNLLFPFSVGATSILFEAKPTPDKLFEMIARHRPTILINVPSAMNQMVAQPGAGDHDLSSLRWATSAGEALPQALHRRWIETFGVEVLDGLGTAEMWHIFVTNRPGRVRAGTVGQVVEGFEVKICDEQGTDLPHGEIGRLWVRGGSRALGYWQNLDLTAAAFQGEWFVGGDLASIDHDGFVTHQGRADDAVKVKGKWLQPQEVESCLLDHPMVESAAVVAVEDEDGLLKPVAFVVRGDAGSADPEEELMAHVLERLEPYKHPRRVIFVDELPQTHLGKVDRAALKRLARS